MTFWIIVVLITLAIAALGFYPLLKNRPAEKTAMERDSLNKSFYFHRLKEVEREAAEGKIEDLEQSKLELQQSLLDDIPAEKMAPSTESKPSKLGFFALVIGVLAIGSTAYVSVGSWQAAQHASQAPQQLQRFFERIKTEESNPLSTQELQQFATALRVHLQDNPQDHQNWFMLGQLGLALDDGQLAFESFQKATQLEPKNMQYRSHYIQFLLSSDDAQEKAQGKEMLKALIREDHTNLDALNLLAFSSFEEGDYQMAAMTWGMMLKLIPEGEARRETIEKSINMAMSLLNEQKPSEPAEQKKEK